MQGVTSLLRRFLPDIRIPDPMDIIRQRWTQDPFTLGAWCMPRPGMTLEDLDAMSEPVHGPEGDQPRLLFAGEACQPDYWSFMHGAIKSGSREGKKAVEILKSK